MRRLLLAAAGALALAGCPIPQAVPDYPPGSVTPPRIVVDDSTVQIAEPGTVIPVPTGCSTAPTFTLSARLRDSNTIESIQARWFVNYDLDNGPSLSPEFQQTISEVDPTDPTLRAAGPWTFQPYIFPKFGGAPGSGSDDGALHVVELVVSNGFDVDGPLPNRSPAPGFEIQLYRWVFVNRPPPVPCTPGQPGCCP